MIHTLAAIILCALAPSAGAFPQTDILISLQAPDGTPLEGKLTLPSSGEAPFPVVFYLHGAGARTYDSPFVYADAEGKPQVGRYLDFHAQELARRGVALFRMSKRGCTPKDGPPGMAIDRALFSGATMKVLLSDYESGLAALRARAEIDPARVVLVGASEGTRLAAELALRAPDGIVGVVLMGYAADNARDTIVWQNTAGPWRNIKHLAPDARDGDLTREEYDRLVAARPGLARALPFEVFDADGSGALTDEDLRQVTRPRLEAILKAVDEGDDEFLWKQLARLSTAYLMDWWATEPTHTLLVKLDVPVAIYHGGLDGACRVEGVHETEQAFEAAGRDNLTVRIYPLANHDLDWTPATAVDGGPEPYRHVFDFVGALVR